MQLLSILLQAGRRRKQYYSDYDGWYDLSILFLYDQTAGQES